MLLVSPRQAVGQQCSPLCRNTFNQLGPTVRSRASPGSPPAATEHFTSATSRQRLAFSNNITKPSSSFDHNVAADSRNLSQSCDPLFQGYITTQRELKKWTGWEAAVGSSQDKLACSKAAVGIDSQHAALSVVTLKVKQVAQVWGFCWPIFFSSSLSQILGRNLKSSPLYPLDNLRVNLITWELLFFVCFLRNML